MAGIRRTGSIHPVGSRSVRALVKSQKNTRLRRRPDPYLQVLNRSGIPGAIRTHGPKIGNQQIGRMIQMI